MSIVVAGKTKDCCILASDGLIADSNGYVVHREYCKWKFSKEGTIAISVVGAYDMFPIIEEHMSELEKLYSVSASVVSIADYLKKCCVDDGWEKNTDSTGAPVYGDFELGFVDLKTFQFYQIDNCFIPLSVPVILKGAKYAATAAMCVLDKSSLSLRDKLQQVVETCIETSVYCGGKIFLFEFPIREATKDTIVPTTVSSIDDMLNLL